MSRTGAPAPGRRPWRVAVVGYGVMTSAFLPSLAVDARFNVRVVSRHVSAIPDAEVEVMTVDDLKHAEFDVVLACLEDDVASRAFWSNPVVRGLLDRTGAAGIEMTTLGHEWAESWHELLAAHGAVSVESPVTGSRPGARTTTLSAFVYASDHHRAAEAVLQALTSRIYRFSTPGAPAKFKLIYNAWGAAILETLAQFGGALEDRMGRDFAVAREIVTSDGWMALVSASKFDRMLDRDFAEPDFAVKHMVKDLRLANVLLGGRPLVSTLLADYTSAAEIAGSDADYTAIATVDFEQHGDTVRGTAR